jgi:hypothetical protein
MGGDIKHWRIELKTGSHCRPHFRRDREARDGQSEYLIKPKWLISSSSHASQSSEANQETNANAVKCSHGGYRPYSLADGVRLDSSTRLSLHSASHAEVRRSELLQIAINEKL